MPIPVNGIKYLHKKFKKMAAILSDDCATGVDATDKSSVHISGSQQQPPQSSCPLPAAPKTSPDVRIAAAPSAVAPLSSLPESVPTSVLCATRVEPARFSPPSQQHQNHQSPQNRISPANGLVVVTDDPLILSQQPSRLSTAFAAKTNSTTFSSVYCNARTSSVSLTSVPASVGVAAVAAVAPLVASPIASATAATAAYVAGQTSLAEDEAGTPAATGRHACPYCKLVCNKPSVLQKHIRAHTNERPFPCQPCGFAFKTSSNLYKHRRSRSHSLKLEEVGVDGKVAATSAAAMVAFGSNNSGCGSRCSSASGGGGSVIEEELLMGDEEDDSQASSRDADASSESESGSSGGSNGKVAQPKKSIYKPKFHKASIYIQNNPLSSVPTASLLSSAGEHLVSASSLNKFGLQLKIPAVSSGSRSLPSTPSPFSGSSPSPEFLQRHISKLISENQAIVETTDPFWSKKFYSRTSKESAMVASPAAAVVSCASVADTMLNAALPKKKVTTSAMAVSATVASATVLCAVGEEEKLANESKLAHALLQPKVSKSISMNDVSAIAEESQPLNLTMCKDMGPSRSAERVTEVAAPVEVVDVKSKVKVLQKQAQVRSFQS